MSVRATRENFNAEVLETAGIVIATVTVNDEFIDSESFGSTSLKDSDNVEFLYFMGGGSL